MKATPLYKYRISKYDGKFRQNGVYVKDEWTSIHDIGRIFNGAVLTRAEYERVEQSYLAVIQEICEKTNVCDMLVCSLEDPFTICTYSEGDRLIDVNTIVTVAQDCLQEKYWCKLETDTLCFHFGYDYYLYVISSLDFHNITRLVNKNGLFVELCESPY